jgi:NAD(P)H-flavin reductase
MEDKYKVLHHDEKFRYMLLSRLKSDCEYYLGNGNRNHKHLWAENEFEHIEVMRLLWNSFSDDAKPEWLTLKQLDNYDKQLVTNDVLKRIILNFLKEE